MRYRIGEFCRLLGISADTLRYDEKRSLLRMPKDPGNGYRSFSEQDAPDVWNLFMLKSLDMNLQEIGALRKGGSFEAQIQYLDDREASLEAEITRLTAKRDRVRELSRLYNLLHSAGQAHLEERMPAHYALYAFGDGCAPCGRTLAEIGAWTACLPYTYIAVEISKESLTGEADSLGVRVGLGILAENVQKAGLAPCPEAVYTPAGARACIAVRSPDVFGLAREALDPLYAFLSERDLRVTGPVAGRIVCSSCREKHPEYVIALSVPVE
ncbi:MAG TPA: MerR family DNA-binding transcriptional regulator [Candidatus Limnocylindria bacterium]|nr:MerR family DNA-binding transcriptional regulator [Candidatus Limnocylindria bacterium]